MGLRNTATLAISVLLQLFLAPGTGWAQTAPDVTEVEVVIATGHSSLVSAVAFSPDGRIIVSGGTDNPLKLWDVASARELRTLLGHSSGVNAVAFSPDGRTIVSGSDDGTLKLWDVASGRVLRTLTGHSDRVYAVAFSPDGRTIASGCYDKTMKLWDVANGRELRTLTGHSSGVYAVAFSPDGRAIVSGSGDKTLKLWNVASGRELRTLTGHSSLVYAVAFSPDGRTIVSGSNDKTLKLWNVASGRELRTLTGHSDRVSSVAFSPDGRIMVSGSGDSTLKLWDVANGRELRTLAGHSDPVSAVAFSPDGRAVMSGSYDSTLKLWDVASGRELRTLTGHSSQVYAVAFSSDGRTILSGSDDKALKLWDAASGRLLRTITGHSSAVCTVAFSPDGRTIASGSGDATLKLWGVASSREAHTITGHSDRVCAVAFSPDGRTIASGSYDKTLKLWDVASGRELRTLTGHSDGLSAVAFAPDGRTMVSGSGDHTLKLWDVASGRELRTLTGHSSWVSAVGFSPDGRTIVSGSYDNTLKLWDVANGRELRTLTGHSSGVYAVAFSPDGRTIVTGGGDNTLKLWDVASGQELRTLTGHSSRVLAVTFSPDGRTIASGSDDKTLKLWDVASGQERVKLISFADGSWLAITPEGFFDASSPAAAQNLSVVRGLEVYSIDQFRDALFRPDLVREKLAGDPNSVVKAAAAKLDLTKVVESGNAPRVSITSPADGTNVTTGEITVEGTVTEQGGGLGRIEWRLNGQPVGIETRGFQRIQDSAAASGTAAVTTKIWQKMVLDAGDNVVEVVAYNAKGLVASLPSTITIKTAGPVAITKPRLFVLAVGVNDYYDGRLKLNYAVPDARSVAASFEKAGTGLYESVKAVTVLDGNVNRANLEKVFTQLASEVKTSDVFVFFIAGHGRTLDGHYYFLPQDFRYSDQASYVENGLSQEQWQKWITLVQARKSVLIYDTCESGTVANDNTVVAARGLQRIEEQAVAYQKLRDATGKTILAASTDTEPALEGYHGHGVFSYVVMEALEKAQTNANGLIEVTGLISYVDDKVPDISYQAFHQRQVPQNKMLGSNFAIGKPTAMAAVPARGTSDAKADSSGASASARASEKPTHVVIAPADVFAAADGKGAAVQRLPAGTLLSLVKTEQGWTLIARDGKSIGYVAADHLAPIQ